MNLPPGFCSGVLEPGAELSASGESVSSALERKPVPRSGVLCRRFAAKLQFEEHSTGYFCHRHDLLD